VLSASSFATLKTVAVGVNPVFVASEPTSTKIYATNFGSYSTSIIQTVNDTVTLALPAPPQDPNCVPTTGQCALQQPFMVLSQ
jgi:DNA-binding beta-propeller fold protein YncE